MGKGPYLRDPVIFAVYKPVGPTSTQVVSTLKKLLSHPEFKGKSPHKKIGHFGTLDPFAEGLLLIGANGATKLSEQIHRELSKTYLAEGILGKRTETGDRMGEERITEPAPEKFQHMQRQELEAFLREAFLGEYWQRPQKYSAAKHQGKALYQWAREGVEVEKPSVKRFIYDLRVVEYDYPHIKFQTTVSTGTYIRVLFEEMAQRMETGGYLKNLYRTGIGDLSDGQALKFSFDGERLSFDGLSREDLEKASLPLDRVLEYPKRFCSDEEVRSFCHGRTLSLKEGFDLASSNVWIVKSGTEAEERALLGLARREGKEDVPEVVFPGPQNRVLKLY